MSKSIKEYCNEMCQIIDELAEMEFAVDSPHYRFQQVMMAAVKSYRMSEEKKDE